MRSVHTRRSTHDHWSGAFPARLAVAGTPARSAFALCSVTPSAFLRPFAPRTLLRFLATMDALTPARCGLRHAPAGQVSLVHYTQTSERSVAKHLMLVPLPLAFSCAGRVRRLTPTRLRLSYAGSSKAPGRIAFAFLRTAHSHLPAPHGASRPPQLGFNTGIESTLPGRDFHPAVCVRSEAHGGTRFVVAGMAAHRRKREARPSRRE